MKITVYGQCPAQYTEYLVPRGQSARTVRNEESPYISSKFNPLNTDTPYR